MIDQELATAGIVRPDLVIGWWAVPTILEHGSQQQVEQFVPARNVTLIPRGVRAIDTSSGAFTLGLSSTALWTMPPSLATVRQRRCW